MSAREHDPDAAAAAGDVPDAARERAQLARQRRRRALVGVVAARGAAAVERRARERAHARVRARAAVVDPRGGDVADPPARGAQAPLPVLLVAGAAERGVEAPDPLERARAARARLAPHANSASRSSGPRSSEVSGSGSRPHARSRPPSSRGADRAAERLVARVRRGRRASSASSQPGQASTSSSRKHSSSPEAASIAELRATLIPRGSPCAR